MRAAFFLGLVVVVGQAGCAHSPVESGKLNQRLEELAQQGAGVQKQIEEMQNRLFLLEDKVDTSRVAIERSKPPQLPVVRLRPTSPEDGGGDEEESPRSAGPGPASPRGLEESGSGEDEPPIGGRSMVARRSVVFDGAASRRGPRPVLRLHEPGGSGSGSGGSAASGVALPGPDPSSVSEKLPVVPLPRRAAAQKLADGQKPGDVQPMQEYQSALAKYRAGDSAAAAEAFRGFFQRYAHHAYADNALYWLAECSYDLKSYQVALKLFRQVVEQYPSGNKAPDALLKMALCYVQLKDKKNARTILGQVVESYPRSQVAKVASAAMAKL